MGHYLCKGIFLHFIKGIGKQGFEIENTEFFCKKYC